MKRRITKQSLEELQKALRTLSQQEQAYYVGGGTGSIEDPYTFVEYQNLLSRKSWMGGYVMGSTTSYTEDGSGNVLKIETIEAIYIAKDEHLLEDVIVYGKKPNREDGEEDYYGISGAYPESEPHMPSGFLLSEEGLDDLSGSYLNGSSGIWGLDYSEESLGGGTRQNWKHTTPWDRSSRFLTRYGIRLKSTNLKNTNLKSTNPRDAEMYLGQELDKLSKSKKFETLMQEIHTHIHPFGIGVSIYAEHLDVNGLTSTSTRKHKQINVRIDISLLVGSDHRGTGSTIVHEMTHAKCQTILRCNNIDIYQLLDKTSSSYANLQKLKNTHPEIYNQYMKCKTIDDILQADHEIMATHYRPIVVQILQEAYPDLSKEDCDALSWGGLHKTKAWEALSKKRQQDIRDRIKQYKKRYEH